VTGAGRAKLASQGVELIGNTPEEFAQVLRDETKRWASVVKAGNIRLE